MLGHDRRPTTTPARSTTGIAPSIVRVAANPSGQLMFTQTSLHAKSGKVTIRFTNRSPEDHTFTLQQGANGKILVSTRPFHGATKTLKVNLPAGSYTYFCRVPGHRTAGMQGTLTVT